MHHLHRLAVLAGLAATAAVLPTTASASPPGPALVRGRLIPADEAPATGLRVYLRAAAWADSADADTLGRFSLALPAALLPGDTVELRADAADPAGRRYHPALLRIAPDSAAAEQRVVLVPREWTVTGGRHAGQRVGISPARAFERVCEGCGAFYGRPAAPAHTGGPQRLRSWRGERFPLRVAFDRDNSRNAITARDSAAFWQIAGALDADLGGGVFRPAPYPAVVAHDEGGPDDVVLVWIEPDLRTSGMGTTTGSAHEITFGAVWLQRSAQIAAATGPRLVTHELVHTLGFGHTCAWRSVLADSSRCPMLAAPAATETDVAYVQLFRRVADLQRRHHAAWGLEAALAGERWATSGTPSPPG